MTLKIRARIPNDWVNTHLNDPIYIFADCYVETEEYFEVLIKMLYTPNYLASNIKPEKWGDIYKLIDDIAIAKYCELREMADDYETHYVD
jgi:hypothetical protein